MSISESSSSIRYSLGLRAGDWVEVRSADEILATLDDGGRLQALPFMPEMLPFCGRRFRVSKTAHKTCDTIKGSVSRRMENAVHLEGLRCDGTAHGGCQAQCLLFWKEAWLKRVPGPDSNQVRAPSGTREGIKSGASPRAMEVLTRATRPAGDKSAEAQELYRCQATEMTLATTPLPWWDLRQYVKDLTSRNVGIGDFVKYLLLAAYNNVMRLNWRLRPYPYVRGLVEGQTPTVDLNLQPGERVQVRSKEEIMLTINKRSRNRGLWFDVEMVPFCGRTFRVLSRVERLLDEKTGKMIRPTHACIILEGVVCGGCLSESRLFCPRGIYSYWHEIWLKRVE